MSFSPTDHSLSTSSGSSIFTPEYDESRIRRRGSDIEEDALQEIWRVQRIRPLCGSFAGFHPVYQPRKFASFAHEAISEDRN